MFKFYLTIFLVLDLTISFAQEKKPPSTDDVQIEKPVSEFGESPNTVQPERDYKPDKNKKSKPSKNGPPKSPYIEATHRKKKRTYYFVVGEFVKFKSGSEKENKAGTIEAIDGKLMTINGQKISVKNLDMIGKRWGQTLQWRSKGVANFAVGTGIAAAGVTFAVISAQYIDLDSPKVVWGTFGATIGTGTALVGFHLIGKGGKEFFQPAKLWKDRGWTFEVK